jgi:hypothetical protein
VAGIGETDHTSLSTRSARREDPLPRDQQDRGMDVPSLDLTTGQLAFLEVLGIIGTVAAALFAAWSIFQASRQAKRSAEALRKERRLDFELDALRDLADVLVNDWSTFGTHQHGATLLRMLPAEGLQVTRDVFAVDGQEGYHQLAGRTISQPGLPILQAKLDGVRVHDVIRAEVVAAIKVRVEHRDE